MKEEKQMNKGKKKQLKRKKHVKRIIVILFFVLIFLIIGCGILEYLGYISIPEIGSVLSEFEIMNAEDVSGRVVKETDNGDDYYYPTKKENIAIDSDTGMVYADNELLVMLENKKDEKKLEQLLIRNFLSLGITLLFHIHKGIIGCRQALDFLAFRYFL